MSAESGTGGQKALDAETLKTLFAQSSLGKGDAKDMKLSDKEKEGFTKAFEDPKFREMFAEYMDEMQDPKYRAETDEYIRQLEKEEKVPAGKELIHPMPGFVAKTHKLDEKGGKMEKLWMNITSSDRVAEPRKQVVKGGESWSLPYSLGPPRMEKDGKDVNVTTFDCCFHTHALDMGSARKEFKDLLVRTAMEGVAESYKRQNTPVKLSTDYHILKGVTYKSGITTAMMVDKKSKDTWKGEKGVPKTGGGDKVSSRVEELPPAPYEQTPEETSQASPPSPESTTNTNKKKVSSIKKGFLGGTGGGNTKQTKQTKHIPQPQSSTQPPSAEAKHGEKPPLTAMSTTKKEGAPSIPSSAIEPAYDVVERGVVDLGDFELTNSDGSTSEKARSTRPKELVVKIKLPKVAAKGIADVNLDISEKKLSLKYKDVYNLQLPLAYPVNDSAGSAKYEKNSQCLVVTLPVKANVVLLPERKSIPEVQRVDREGKPVDDKSNREHSNVVSKSTKASEKRSEKDIKAADKNSTHRENGKKEAPDVSSSPSSVGKENKSGLRSLDEKEVRDARSLREEIEAGAAKALEEAKTKKISPSPAKKKASSPKHNVLDPNAPTFIAKGFFDGPKPGYVFKRGAEGVGYYLDNFGKGTRQEKEEVARTPSNDSTSKKTTDNILSQSPEKRHSSASGNEMPQVPPFEYRQTPQAFSVIIKVSGVLKSSMSVKFKARSVQIVFRVNNGGSDESKPTDGATCKSTTYAMELFVPETLPPAFELNCDKSTFDVAEENVVVILMKKNSGIWPETKDDAGALLLAKQISAALLNEEKPVEAKDADKDTSAHLAAKAMEMKLNDASTNALYELD